MSKTRRIKAGLIGPYIDYIMLTERPSDEKIGAIFDKMYEKSESELKVYKSIYTKKLEELNDQEEENR